MARKNKLGTSYCSLGLEDSEEVALIQYLSTKKWSCKSYLRMLIRTDLEIQIKLKIAHDK